MMEEYSSFFVRVLSLIANPISILAGILIGIAPLSGGGLLLASLLAACLVQGLSIIVGFNTDLVDYTSFSDIFFFVGEIVSAMIAIALFALLVNNIKSVMNPKRR